MSSTYIVIDYLISLNQKLSGIRKSRHLKDIRIWIEKDKSIRDYFGSKDITKITSSDISVFYTFKY